MDRILSLIPKNLLAFLAIGGGILFIVISQPPHTVCDSQIEALNLSQKAFFQRNTKIQAKDPDGTNTSQYEKLRDHCKRANNPGGCYELFQGIRTLLRDLSILPQNCMAAASDISKYRKAIEESTDLFVRLAWGEAPPPTYSAKFGWLDSADLSLFCKLKVQYVAFFGEDALDRFRERMMRELPGAKDIPRNQVWDLSIFSENCAKYP